MALSLAGGVKCAMAPARAWESGEHSAALTDLEEGIDPGAAIVWQRRVDRAAPTLGDLAAEYLERWAKPRKRSWKEDQRFSTRLELPRFRGHLTAWGSTPGGERI